MAMATVGALGMLLITVLSLGFIRRHLAYETWYFIHLLIYASLVLAFAHEIFLGSDFAFDPLARAFWIAVNVTVLVIVVVSRWGKAIRSIARPLTVLSVTPLNDVAAAVELGGSNVSELRAAAGQFALLRPLTRELFWQPHPYSISAAPRVDRIRFTIKALGGASEMMTHLPVGTKVAIEGPYGTKIYEELRGSKLLLIAGGVGHRAGPLAPGGLRQGRRARRHLPCPSCRGDRPLRRAGHPCRDAERPDHPRRRAHAEARRTATRSIPT